MNNIVIETPEGDRLLVSDYGRCWAFSKHDWFEFGKYKIRDGLVATEILFRSKTKIIIVRRQNAR